MSGALWVPGIERHDLSHRRGNHVAGWRPKGVVLHVNDSPKGSYGTSVAWYASGGGPDEVCPTWQVYPDGKAVAFLPANVQPWTQRDGNSWGVSIETGGNHAEPLTAAALATCGRIMRFMHDEWDIPYAVVDSPAHHGLGTHQMGGQAWGGHPCPGTKRAAQRHLIIDAARGHRPSPTTEDLTIMDADTKKYLDKRFADLWARLGDIDTKVTAVQRTNLPKRFADLWRKSNQIDADVKRSK